MHYRLAILTTEINPSTIQAMVKAAQLQAKRLKADIVSITKTTGCLDMPVIAKKILLQPEVDGVVVLGAVAQGETGHDELVVNAMTNAIIQLSIQYDKPVGFGVIGPKAKREHFASRTQEYGARAVEAVVHSLKLLRK